METFVILNFPEAAIAQLGERETEDLKVPGSIPGLGTGKTARTGARMRKAAKDVTSVGTDPQTARLPRFRRHWMQPRVLMVRVAPGVYIETIATLKFAEAAIAQLGERQTEDLKVPGSIPGLGMFFLSRRPAS